MPIIINGGSYRAGGWWGKHLENGEKNERVQLVEITGLTAEKVPDAFREMEGIAAGTKCKNYFYQANINPREDERLTPAQWREAIDTLEKNLGLTGQPRFVVEHEKKGRVHQHVVWSRIDPDRMVAISDSLTAPIHERTSRQLEVKFDLERGRSILTPNRDFERPDRRPQKDETFRTAETGIDPATVKAQLKELWQHADNGQSFKAALESEGYVLARGDRRDFVVIDRAGDDHSLARRLGVKAADVRERMADIDRAALPSVAEAKTEQRARQAERGPHEAEQTPEPQAGARSRFDPLRETEREVARDQFPGRYDELRAAEPSPEVAREFASNANRTAEPAAPIFDRDAANMDWEAKLIEAAIHVPEPEREGQTHQPAEEGIPTSQPASENAPEATAARPNVTPEPEMAGTPASGLKDPERVASGIFGGIARMAETILGGLFSFFGAAEPKLSPQQAERAARSGEEQAEANARAAADQEIEAARDRVVADQDRQQQQVDLSRYIRTGRPPVREANAGRENEDDYGRERER